MQLKTKEKSDVCIEPRSREMAVSYSLPVHVPAPGIGSRISDLSKKIGKREKASKMIGISTPQLQRYIREESSAPFDVMARLCAVAGVSLEWLATGQGQALSSVVALDQPHGIDTEMLTAAIRLLERMLQATNRRLTPDQMAEAVLLTLELLRSGLPEVDVLPLVRRAIGLAQITV